jgi:hypothetical protein
VVGDDPLHHGREANEVCILVEVSFFEDESMLEVYEWNDFSRGVRAMSWFYSCSRLVATGYRTPLPDPSNENAASDANTQKAATF